MKFEYTGLSLFHTTIIILKAMYLLYFCIIWFILKQIYAEFARQNQLNDYMIPRKCYSKFMIPITFS